MIKIMQTPKTLLILGLVFCSLYLGAQSKWDKKKSKFRKGTDQGMSSKTHEKYIGKIVFSNARISKDNPDESDFRTTFKADENLYGRVYMAYSASREPMFEYYDEQKRKIEEPCDYGCSYAIILERKETGETQPIRCNDLGGDELKWTSIQLSLYPDALNGDPEEPDREWVYWMRELPAGEHTFTATYFVGEGACNFDAESNSGYAHVTDPMATGEFTIIKEDGMEIPFRMTFERYESVMDLSSLRGSILERAHILAREAEWAIKYTRVTAIGDWEYERDVYNNVIRRSCDTRILGKDADGNCAAYPFTVIQEHMGGGRYGQVKTAFQGLVGTQGLDCG